MPSKLTPTTDLALNRRFQCPGHPETVSTGMEPHGVRQEAVDAVDLPSVARGLSGTPVALTVNGTGPVVDLEPRVSLLDALREHLAPTRSTKGGDQGRRQPCQPAGCRPGCPRCAPARPVARSAGMTV